MTAPGTGPAAPAPGEARRDAPDAPGDGWLRLDPRNRLVAAVFLAGPPIIVALVWLAGRGLVPSGLRWTISSLGVTGMVVGAIALGEWFTVRYRVTAERLQVRSGIVVRNHRSIPRDRIRSVDATASPLHRAFGLVTVKIGTGQHVGSGDEELKLDGVSPAEADRLRTVLLYRAPSTRADGPEPRGAGAGGAAPPSSRTRAVAVLAPSWLRYAPLTVSALLGVFAILGAAYKPLDALGLGPRDIWRWGAVRGAVGEIRMVPLWLVIVTGVAAVVVLAVLGATALYILTWWGFRLDDEGATWRTRRGLLTTRSVTLEKRRMRGVEIAEPLLLRAGRGARVNAVAVGLTSGSRDRNDNGGDTHALLPPAPRAEARRVATRVLGDDPMTIPLRPHPRRALRRRVNRAVAAVVAVAVVAAVLGVWWLPSWAWVCAVVLLPVLLPFAFDAYRSLGHEVTPAYLVTRFGTGVRRTVALRRDGIIGWKITRSPFQRRAGLATLAATTAANDGAYRVRDVAPAAALDAAERAVPGLLAPFVERTADRDTAG